MADMGKNTNQKSSRAILVSTPWPLYNRPSVQLGTLKAFLNDTHPQWQVDAYHAYLKVAEATGYKTYHAVSQKTWPAECVYGALLFPERREKIEKLFRREAQGEKDLARVAFEPLVTQIEKISNVLIDGIDWSRYRLAGFSICLCQLTSSLYFIRRIKKAHPTIPIVVGGSLFPGELGRDFIKTFPEVDFFISGEGEMPLGQLLNGLDNMDQCLQCPPDPAIITPKNAEKYTPVCGCQLKSLKDLPCPDYDDYFKLLKTLKPDKAFFPTLPLEISRGCWWSGTTDPSSDKGCAFCNLNLQWRGYRFKQASQVTAEVDALTSRHRVLSVAFMDNLLPLHASGRIFPALENLGKDLKLFGEIRATTPKHILKTMKSAGVQEVQVGIESLSTNLLKKLGKGTTAIQNLQMMRDCEELGIWNVSNLILDFPGSDRQDLEETLGAIDFAQPFRPLRAVTFWLGFGSPVWRQSDDYGIKAVRNHPHYRCLFPERIFQSMRFMIQSYRGDRARQQALWRPVRNKIKLWEEAYENLHRAPFSPPILTYRDGGDFLIISHRRFGKDPMTHRLVGPSRLIYLFCCRNRSIKRILAAFPTLGENKVLPFLKMMVDKNLMFEEKDRYLSLAVAAVSR